MKKRPRQVRFVFRLGESVPREGDVVRTRQRAWLVCSVRIHQIEDDVRVFCLTVLDVDEETAKRRRVYVKRARVRRRA